jgi:hypothetical protein
MELTGDEVAYSAGFFDGEGSAFWWLDPRTGGPTGAVTVTQTQTGVLEWLGLKWGFGSISKSKTSATKGGFVYQWRFHGDNAVEFLTAVRPHLHVKGERVDAWLRIRAMQGSGGRKGHARTRKGTFLAGANNPEQRALVIAAVLEYRQGSGRKRAA